VCGNRTTRIARSDGANFPCVKSLWNNRFPSSGCCCRLARDCRNRPTRPEPMPTPEKPDNQRKIALREFVQAESMIQIALVLPISCVIGWAIGDFLDHKLHQSWIGIAGLAVGIAAGLCRLSAWPTTPIAATTTNDS